MNHCALPISVRNGSCGSLIPLYEAKTYLRVDSSGLNELYARTDQVGFLTTQRVDGKLILPEAVQLLQMAPQG